MQNIRFLSFLLGLLVLFSSCSSTTLIQTSPSKAKLYLNEVYVGTTPVSYTDSKIVGSCTAVRIEKEGYQTLHTSLCRNEEPDAGAIIAGFFVLLPWLWAMKYYPQHNYELKPLQEGVPQNGDYFYEVPEEVIQQQPPQPIQHTKANRLRELKELLNEGILTQEEFDNEKKKILDE